MNKFSNETTIYCSKDGVLEVTNLRVCKMVKSGSNTEISRIFLENLSSSRLRSSDPKWLLYVGIFLLIASIFGVVLAKSPASLVGVAVGAVPLVLYYFLHLQFLEFVGVGGETISFPTKMGFGAAEKLLSQIEGAQAEAKHRLVNSEKRPA